jgi:TetR/AcrR family transcriptional repressor of nem operon
VTGHIDVMPRPSIRNKLVEGSRPVLHRHGFHASSIDLLTRAAGVPKGSFFNHFRTKDDLALAVLERYWADAAALLPDCAESGDTAGALLAHFQSLAAATRRSGLDAGCLVGNLAVETAGGNPVLRARLAAILSEWSARLAAVITAGRACRQLGDGPPAEALARHLVDAWEGAVLRAKVEASDRAFTDFLAVLPLLLGRAAPAHPSQ